MPRRDQQFPKTAQRGVRTNRLHHSRNTPRSHRRGHHDARAKSTHRDCAATGQQDARRRSEARVIRVVVDGHGDAGSRRQSWHAPGSGVGWRTAGQQIAVALALLCLSVLDQEFGQADLDGVPGVALQLLEVVEESVVGDVHLRTGVFLVEAELVAVRVEDRWNWRRNGL